MTKDPPATLDEPDTDCEVIQKLRAQIVEMDLDRTHNARERDRLRGALRDLINAYLSDVNPNDRNQAAIEHARRNIGQVAG